MEDVSDHEFLDDFEGEDEFDDEDDIVDDPDYNILEDGVMEDEESKAHDLNFPDLDTSTLAVSQTSSVTKGTTSESSAFSHDGRHGRLIKSHKHPRITKSKQEIENGQVVKFTDAFFNGNLANAKAHISLFKASTEEVGDGIIRAISQLKGEGGVKLTQYMARRVYHVGQKRFDRAVAVNGSGKKKKQGGRRENAVSDDMIEQIARMVDPNSTGDHSLTHIVLNLSPSYHMFSRHLMKLTGGLPLEVGFPCAHGKIQKYPTTVTTMAEVFEFYKNYESSMNRVRKMAYKTFLQYMNVTQPGFSIRKQQKDVCDVCERIRIDLKNDKLTEAEREKIEEELRGHQDKARAQRRAMKEFVQLALCTAEGVPATHEAIAAIVSRIPDDFVPSEKGPPPSIVVNPLKRVRLLLEDFAGNLEIPWYGQRVPGQEYYLSKLHEYMFISSNIGDNRNIVLVYDQRAGGKGYNAMNSLRFYVELKHLEEHRTAGTLSERPMELISVRDNCVGQNKSQSVLRFCALLQALGFYRRIVLSFLTKGHSHMKPDQVTTWCKSTLRGKQLYSGADLVTEMNTCSSVEASYLDYMNKKVTLPLWSGWDDVLDKSGIHKIPTIHNGGYTQFAVFEFGDGRMTMRRTYDGPVEHEVPMYVAGTKDAVAAKALQLLFGKGKTLDTVTASDVILPRHPEMPLTDAQIKSIAQKKNFIPSEYHHHYPAIMLEPVNDEVQEQKVDKDGGVAQKKDTTSSKSKKKGAQGPITLVGRSSVLDWIVRNKRPVAELVEPPPVPSLIPGMKQRAMAAANGYGRRLVPLLELFQQRSASKGAEPGKGQPGSGANGLPSASGMGESKSVPNGVDSSKGQRQFAYGMDEHEGAKQQSRMQKFISLLQSHNMIEIPIDDDEEDNNPIAESEPEPPRKKMARRPPRQPGGIYLTRHGDSETMTSPWYSMSCPADAFVFPTLFDPYARYFAQNEREIFHQDFPELCGALFPALLNREMTFVACKQDHLYRLLDIPSFWEGDMFSIDLLSQNELFKPKEVTYDRQHVLKLMVCRTLHCTKCGTTIEQRKARNGVQYLGADMFQYAAIIADEQQIPSGGDIPMEIFLEAYQDCLFGVREYTFCGVCEEVVNVEILKRPMGPLLLQIDVLTFRQTSGAFPYPLLSHYGRSIAQHVQLNVMLNGEAYRLHSVIYNKGNSHFITRILRERQGLLPKLWFVDGMENFPSCRGYGVDETPTGLPIEQWFPMTFQSGKNHFMAVLVTYLKVAAITEMEAVSLQCGNDK